MAKWGMAPSSTKATPGAYGSLFKIPAMDSFVVKAVNFAGITSLNCLFQTKTILFVTVKFSPIENVP